MKNFNYIFILLIVFSLAFYSCDDDNTEHIDKLNNIYINELMADNKTGITDENGKNEDWIEIYNDNNEEFDMTGLQLADTHDKWKFQSSDSCVIPAKGFLLLWADNDDDEGVLHTNFKLSKDGEKIQLLQKIDDTIIIIDEMAYDVAKSDQSFGRVQDGKAEMDTLSQSSPGASNNK